MTRGFRLRAGRFLPVRLVALVVCVGLAVSAIGAVSACGTSVERDDPVVGAEPAGSDTDGSATTKPLPEGDSTDYGLLVLIAVGLIVAGALLVRVERWGRAAESDR